MKNTKFLLTATLVALLTACGGGGGGGGGGSTTAASTVLTGTAATGAALSNATITVKDSKGATKTATANADGSFSVDVTGMTAPFIVQAVSQDGSKTYYSMVEKVPESKVINVTSITDTLAQSSGQTPSAVFADPTTKLASVDFKKMATAQANFKTALGDYMQALGIASGDDLMSTAFTANNTKTDALLDCLKSTSGVLSVKAACTGGSEVTAFDPAVNVATVPTKVAAPAAGTLDYLPTNLPKITAQLKKLSDAWNGTGGDLATVMTATLDANGTYDDGKSLSAFIADQVAKFKAGDRGTISPGSLVGFDSSANTVDMCEQDSFTESGKPSKGTSAATFKMIDGVWKMTTASAAAKAACNTSSSNSSAMQATVRAVSKYNATGPKTPGLLATVVPSSYFLCIGTGTTHIANGGLITANEKCGTAGTGGTLSSTFDVSSWKPSSGTIALYAYFVDDYTTTGKMTVINWSGIGDMTLDSTGKLSFNTIDVCAGRYNDTTQNCGTLADGVSGVQ